MSASALALSSPAARFHFERISSRQLRFGIDVTLSGWAVIRRLARALPDEAADLMEIAASIHAIDRIALRPHERQLQPESMWTRSLWAEIPVREPDRWRRQASQLVRLLHWLTDDYWDLEFSQLRLGTGTLDEQQGFLFETVPSGASRSCSLAASIQPQAWPHTSLTRAPSRSACTQTDGCGKSSGEC